MRDLQTALDHLGFILAPSGPGASGDETDYYGALTEAAVRAFQKAKRIVSTGTVQMTGYGQAGPLTRGALEAALKACAPLAR